MKKVFISFLAVLTVLIILLTAAIVCITAYAAKYKECSVDDRLLSISANSEDTHFYCFSFSDRTKRSGEAYLLENTTLNSGQKYEFVPFNEIPNNLINAFISIEDKRFYKHHGIDILRTGHATINYLFGRGDFGGSTITQQLIKNLTGNTEISPKRKLSEAFSAIDLEKRYTKNEILELYLNIINLSEGCRGIGAAAQYFYSKDVSELSLDECASLAAITNNPAKYDPLRHPENNRQRRNIILKAMLEQGYINSREYETATAVPITLNTDKNEKNEKYNSWYIDTVIDDVSFDLSQKYGISQKQAVQMIYSGGLNIYIAMDENVQSVLDDYYSNIYNFPASANGEIPQSSMIVIDPHTGDILGIAGAVGKKQGNRLQNYATCTKRPTGSTIKPISVYAPALDSGLINWATIIEDSPIKSINGKPWPSNANKIYSGNVNIKYAVEASLNTVAVKTLGMLGNKKSFDFLSHTLLINSLDINNDMGDASLALGQQSHGITLRELTAAYSIFEQGIMSKPRSYFTVTDKSGKIILDNPSYQTRAISNESATIMTKMLESVVKTGTACDGITLDSITEVAGKSGTTQNNCDRYFVGYTPELLAGVWLGFDYPKPLDEFGGNVSVYIWDEVMKIIYNTSYYGKEKKFPIPDTVQKISINKSTGNIPAENDAPTLIEDGWFESQS